jgi:HEAT repeat protein
MKTYKRIGGNAMLVLLVFLLADPLAAAGDLSGKAAIAVDRTQTAEDRMGAIFDLGASADERVAPVLLGLLRDVSEENRIRTSAVLALVNLGKPRVKIISTFETVYGEPNAGKNFRYTILLSLGKMKAIESLPLLAEALSSKESMIRLKAAQALGALENEAALLLMARHVEKEEDYMVRAVTVRAAGQSQSTTAEGILVKSLRSDPAPLVRNNAAIMLGKFKKLRPEAQAAIEAAREDESLEVRNTARGIQP